MENHFMSFLLLAVSIVINIMTLIFVITMFLKKKSDPLDGNLVESFNNMVQKNLDQFKYSIKSDLVDNINSMGENIQKLQKSSSDAQFSKLNDIDYQLNQKVQDVESRISKQISTLSNDTANNLENIRKTVDKNLQGKLDERMTYFGQTLAASQKQATEAQEKQFDEIAQKINQNLSLMNQSISEKQEQAGKNTNEILKALEVRFQTLESNNEQKLDNIRATISKHLTSIQEENQKKLDSIQSTVNEKLESQLQKSFRLVSDQLETVHKSLGEMQSIASGVGDLKRVLSNVKTRGILGEIQLGNILEPVDTSEKM